VFNVYKSIYDCPIRAYQCVFEFDDLTYLVKNRRYSLLARKRKLIDLIDHFIGQIIDEFGVSRKYELRFYKRRDLVRLRLDWILGNKSAGLTMQVIQRELDRMEQKVPTLDELRKQNATMHRILTQWSGQDTRTLTIFEYYNLEKDYVDQSEKQSMGKLQVKRGKSPMRETRKQA
jgi:hypothetical protein